MDLNKYFNFDNNSVTYGLTESLIAFYVKELKKIHDNNIIILTSNLYETNKIYNNLSQMLTNVLMFPMDDFIASKVVAISPEFELARLNTLEKLQEDKQIIVTDIMGYLKFLPDKNADNKLELDKNKIYKRQDLIDSLINLGYKRESMVTTTGEFSVRGYIVDIYPIEEEHPIRIEFDGDYIESIRYFDENTQRTIYDINNILIKSFCEINTDINNSLYDYSDNGIVIYYNKDQIDVAYNKLCEEITEYNDNNNTTEKHMYEFKDINPKYELYIDNISNMSDIEIKEIPPYNENFELLKDNVFKWNREGKKVYFYLTNNKEIKIIKEYIPDATIVNEKLNKGFIINDIVCISENDIGIHVNTQSKYHNSLKIGKRINNYNELEKGDYVVHINHGIGIYNGLVTLKKGDLQKDYIQLLYADNDKIYVPVEKINNIYKYTDKNGVIPKLNKLNSLSWAKTKTYIKSKAKDISKDLLKLYAKRSQIKGVSYKDYVEQDIFASSFEYSVTRDQEKAITEINKDLNSSVPMDRLLCGDVGFGKTEVAMRAIFKTVINNYQVLYLCPTTILAKQQ